MGLYKFQSDDAPDIYGEVIFESKDGVLVRRDSADLYSVWKPIEKKTLALGGFECLKTTYNKLEAIKMAEQLPVPPKMQ